MVDITCPWCQETGVLPFLELEEPEVSFTCADCGTTVEFSEEPAAFELAA